MIRTPKRFSFFSFAILATLFILFDTLPVLAQDRCATVEYTQKQMERGNVLETPAQFEQWMQRHRVRRDGAGHRPKSTSYKIAVVVHVVHNGEPEGTGTNIPDAQILSQIDVLNKDYQRLNADAANTPAEFLPLAGSLDIEFILAKQDPEGLATDGILRTHGSKSAWSVNDNYQLKTENPAWDTDDYLNLWVVKLTGGFLGYAQLPVSGLPGLEKSSTNAQTDGVVIAYDAFGANKTAFPVLDSRYDRGRTATHEIGHFLGLRHIWGDDNICTQPNDYVDDTPDQVSATTSCPTTALSSCGVHTMYQNYMDYTFDACMNLFTQQQIDRMITVLDNSPRRSTLSDSHGLVAPTPVANDAGIKSIMSPTGTSCDNSIVATLEIRNYGNNAVTSVTIELKVNNTVNQTQTFAVNLVPGQVTVRDFASQVPLDPGQTDISFTVTKTNNITDPNASNNQKEISTYSPATVPIPFLQPFNTLPADWVVTDPDGFNPWTLVTAPNTSPGNKAISINFYDYEDAAGEIDILTTPVFDLSTAPLAILYFDVAYAWDGVRNDGLEIYVLKECNENIYDGTLIFSKSGQALATATTGSSGFVPHGVTDWRKLAINLGSFLGEERLQLAFVGRNEWGDNLYLDNIAVLTDDYEDMAVESATPNLVTCDLDPAFNVTVRNTGTRDITTFDLRLQAVGKSAALHTFTIPTMAPGESREVTVPPYPLASGASTITIDVLNPNGQTDVNEADNQLQVNLIVNNQRYVIPYRESFEDGFTSDWTMVSPTGGMQWTTQAGLSMFGASAVYRAFDNETAGDEAWLISPVFDFSDATEASLQFYSSYAVNGTHADRLRVLYSDNCGATFQDLAFFDKAGDGLTTKTSTGSWAPQSLPDWQHRVLDLSALAGLNDLRFAFVADNDHGNNLYIDNINFSPTIEPNPLLNEQLFVVYQKKDEYDFYLTFNLPDKQPVQYEVLDAMGRGMVRGTIPDVLNQTYPVRLGDNKAEGVYIVRLAIGGKKYYSTKLFLGR